MTAGEEKLNLEKTALLLCDLQNDFLHPDGAYGRNGMSKPEISALPDRLKPVADKIRSKNGNGSKNNHKQRNKRNNGRKRY